METSVWLMDLLPGKVEWKCTFWVFGELFIIQETAKMPVLCAVNSDMTYDVRHHL